MHCILLFSLEDSETVNLIKMCLTEISLCVIKEVKLRWPDGCDI